jgi:predicted Zn-dependent protease
MKLCCCLCLLLTLGCNTPVHVQTDLHDLAGQGYALRLAGKSDSALTLLKQAAKDHPKDDRIWFELARTHWHQWPVKHAHAAVAHAMDRACKLAPKNSRYWLWAGHAHTYNSIAKAHHVLSWGAIPGEMIQGAKCLKKALSLDSNCHEARYVLYCLYSNNPWFLGGNKHKAQALLKETESVDMIAATRIKADQFSYHEPQKRLDLWLPLLETDPNSPFVHEEISTLYARLGHVTLAHEHAQKVGTLDSTRRFFLIKLAGKIRKQDPALAETLIQICLDDDTIPIPIRANALTLLSTIQKEQGHEEQAQATAQEAQALDPYTWKDSPDILDLFTAEP